MAHPRRGFLTAVDFTVLEKIRRAQIQSGIGHAASDPDRSIVQRQSGRAPRDSIGVGVRRPHPVTESQYPELSHMIPNAICEHTFWPSPKAPLPLKVGMSLLRTDHQGQRRAACHVDRTIELNAHREFLCKPKRVATRRKALPRPLSHRRCGLYAPVDFVSRIAGNRAATEIQRRVRAAAPVPYPRAIQRQGARAYGDPSSVAVRRLHQIVEAQATVAPPRAIAGPVVGLPFLRAYR